MTDMWDDDGPRPGDIIDSSVAPRNAWVSPNGIVHHANDYGHGDAAYRIIGDIVPDPYETLLSQGWLHVSCANIYSRVNGVRTYSQRHIDMMFDWYMTLQRMEYRVDWQHRMMVHIDTIIQSYAAS